VNIIVERTLQWSQCEWEKDEDCFKKAKWFIEGGSYCERHAKKVLQILKDEGFDVPDIGGD